MAKAEVAGADLESIKAMLGNAKEIYKKEGFYASMELFKRIMAQLENMVAESAPKPAPAKPAPEPTPVPVQPVAPRKPVKKVAPKAAATPSPPPKGPPSVILGPKERPSPLEVPRPVVEKITADPYKREAKKRISAYEKKVMTLKREGTDVGALEDMIHRAKLSVEKGKGKESIEIIELGEKETDELAKIRTKGTALDLLSMITEKITKLKSKGLETDQFEGIMAKGVRAFDKDMFDECISIIRKLDMEMDRVLIKASPRYDNVRNMIRQLEDEVNELRAERMNTLELEDMIEDCWSNLDSDLDFSEELVKEAREKVERLKDQHDSIMREFKEAQNRIETLEQKGYNTTTVQGIYHDALIVLYSGNMKMAREHLDQMKDEIAEIESHVDEGEFVMPVGSDDPLVNTLKQRITQMEEEIIVKTEEISRKEHEISELYIVIKELEEKAREAKESQIPERICPDCSAKVPDLKFCGQCAHEFEKVCPSCETVIPKGFIFCGKCGTKIE